MNDLIILGLLADGPRHGYQLKREAGLVLGQDAMHNNVVYPLLRRFADEGWVTRRSSPGERGQTRHLYALTAKGRRVLIDRLAAYTDANVGSDAAFAVRVGHFELLDAATRAHILATREAYLRARVDQLAMLADNFELGPYPAEVITFLGKRLRSELAWIDRLRRHDAGGRGQGARQPSASSETHAARTPNRPERGSQ